VILTVDLPLQRIVEQVLVDLMRKHTPRSASALIVEPTTGEILAWASRPAFDPQRTDRLRSEDWRNRPLSDQFEPGSAFGFIAVAAAVNEGLVTLEDRLDCGQGTFSYQGAVMRDSTPHGVISVREILARSSNIGLAQIGLRLGPEKFYYYMTNFGFGQRSGITLPEETAGLVPPVSRWDQRSLTRMPIGYGIAASQLQLTMALCAIANEGRLMRPWIVRQIESPQRQVVKQYKAESVRTVIRPETCDQVIKALQAAVSPEGTGRRAALDTHTVAGKTGIAQKMSSRGAQLDRYYASFVGVVPATKPELCISVAIDEPTGTNAGAEIAAPIFAQIAKQAVVRLGIPPDKGPRSVPERAKNR
jgi:cell division protein FtsI/penicillin-binding protein 2